jgi:hypothetical protein
MRMREYGRITPEWEPDLCDLTQKVEKALGKPMHRPAISENVGRCRLELCINFGYSALGILEHYGAQLGFDIGLMQAFIKAWSEAEKEESNA